MNGNTTDDDAVALACEVARRGKASVYAIYVIEVKRTLPLDVDLPPEAAKGDTVLARAEHVADEFDVDLETEILQARDVGHGHRVQAEIRRVRHGPHGAIRPQERALPRLAGARRARRPGGILGAGPLRR